MGHLEGKAMPRRARRSATGAKRKKKKKEKGGGKKKEESSGYVILLPHKRVHVYFINGREGGKRRGGEDLSKRRRIKI